jgi:hypothetical protein
MILREGQESDAIRIAFSSFGVESSARQELNPPTARVGKFNNAFSMAQWVHKELDVPKPDYGFIIRCLTTEIHRWFVNDFSDEEFSWLTQDYDTTTYKDWDALFEGIVLYLCHKHNKKVPDWAYRTSRSSAFFPRDYLIRNHDDYIETVFETPAEILEKGVIFSRRELSIS